MKLSIIIPYYNYADYLPDLLDSIPNREDIEVIVVDDHSTEKLAEYRKIEEKYSKRNILFVKNRDEWKGAGSARNQALEIANGEWILVYGADDFMTSNVEKTLDSVINSDADIVFFPPTSIDEQGSVGERHLRYKKLLEDYLSNPNKINEWKLRVNWSCDTSMLIRRSILGDNIRFDNVRYSNDVMFSTKVGIKAKKIEVCSEPIYCIREHGGSLVTTISNEARTTRIKVNLRKYMYLMKYIPYKYRKEVFKKSRLDEIKMIKDHIKFNVFNMKM